MIQAIHALQPFPNPVLNSGEESRTSRHLRVDFAIQRGPSALDFHFVLIGSVAAELKRVVRSAVASGSDRRRKDDLWKGTCFEVFFGPSDGRQYFEMNMAPSGDWNLYAFDDYRSGMRSVEGANEPFQSHEEAATGDRIVWHGRIHADAGELKNALSRPSLVVSATAVIEYVDGAREYWALSHAGAKPDFHLRESFRLVL